MVGFPIIRQYAQKAEDVYLPEAELNKKYPSAFIKTIPHLDVQFFIETNASQKYHFISVRGTANHENIKTDAEIVKIWNKKLGAHFHEGFHESALAIYCSLPPLRKDFQIRLSGHSLGGAIAVILMMMLKVDGFSLGQGISFGQPKVTNRKGVLKYRDLPLLRVTNFEDPVPMVPPSTFLTWFNDGLFRHVGQELLLYKGKYKFFSERKSERIAISSFWFHLFRIDIKAHFMKSYQSNLSLK